jgi:hypothetical protein
MMVPTWNSALGSQDFPLTGVIGNAGKEKKKPAHQRVTKHSLRDYAQQD